MRSEIVQGGLTHAVVVRIKQRKMQACLRQQYRLIQLTSLNPDIKLLAVKDEKECEMASARLNLAMTSPRGCGKHVNVNMKSVGKKEKEALVEQASQFVTVRRRLKFSLQE